MQAQGSCLCSKVKYEITGTMGIFQYCHCSRCRKHTGSGHAANIFAKPEQFHWIQGQDDTETYEPENTKYFATSFCKTCGSTLPWLSKSGKVMVVPAGTLDTKIPLKPQQNIFWNSKADWYTCASELVKYDELPTKQ